LEEKENVMHRQDTEKSETSSNDEKQSLYNRKLSKDLDF
jgi:hypothetical protein